MSRNPARFVINTAASFQQLASALLAASISLPSIAAATDEVAIEEMIKPASPQTVNILTYHDTPPYFTEISSSTNPTGPQASVDLQQGLYPEFIRLVNRAQNHYRLALSHQPRKRIQLQLQQNALQGAVIGVNPVWFRDKQRTRYLWSPAFMADQDVLVVNSTSTLQYRSLRDFVGITFALPRGYYFKGVTELALQGDIDLIETSSDLQNLKLVQYGRAQATITSKPTITHFKRTLFQNYPFRQLSRPHDEFTRHWLFPRSQDNLFRHLSSAIGEVAQSQRWHQILTEYDATPVLKK